MEDALSWRHGAEVLQSSDDRECPAFGFDLYRSLSKEPYQPYQVYKDVRKPSYGNPELDDACLESGVHL